MGHSSRTKRNRLLTFIIIILIIGTLYAIATDKINLSTLKSLGIPKENNCPEGIVPIKIVVKIGEFYEGYKQYSPSFKINDKWADGTNIQVYYGENSAPWIGIAEDDCQRGSSTGQNINYFYCRPLIYQNTKTEISPEGVVGRQKEYKYHIDLVLKPLGEIKANYITSSLGNIESISGEVWSTPPSVSWGYSTLYMNYEIVSSKCSSVR